MMLTCIHQLDVDYEYPSNNEQAQGYVALLHELRHGLDQHARRKGADYRFLLTVRVFFTHKIRILMCLSRVDRCAMWS